MRRALVLGAASFLLAAAVGLALAVPDSAVPGGAEPRITRLFIPAIKATCLAEAGLSGDVDIGYTFTDDGALVTLDRNGTVSGIPSYQLYVLNGCLARYPVHPPEELPRDHYSRNLLYDYFGGVLKPCLESHVTGLPELPTRADFVERLYPWDPYRSIARGRSLNELLTLELECPALPRYLVPD
ncbi:MAG: hypothetical protein JWP32_1495 [Schumannella sp.]|nr:hypothetical protein [Schumannella sp.]